MTITIMDAIFIGLFAVLCGMMIKILLSFMDEAWGKRYVFIGKVMDITNLKCTELSLSTLGHMLAYDGGTELIVDNDGDTHTIAIEYDPINYSVGENIIVRTIIGKWTNNVYYQSTEKA